MSEIIWTKGIDPVLGWEVLSMREGYSTNTFTRDPHRSRFYYLSGVAPTTWKEIAEQNNSDQLRTLKTLFDKAFAYEPLL